MALLPSSGYGPSSRFPGGLSTREGSSLQRVHCSVSVGEISSDTLANTYMPEAAKVEEQIEHVLEHVEDISEDAQKVLMYVGKLKHCSKTAYFLLPNIFRTFCYVHK